MKRRLAHLALALMLGAGLLGGCSTRAQQLYKRAETFFAQGKYVLAAADYGSLLRSAHGAEAQVLDIGGVADAAQGGSLLHAQLRQAGKTGLGGVSSVALRRAQQVDLHRPSPVARPTLAAL